MWKRSSWRLTASFSHFIPLVARVSSAKDAILEWSVFSSMSPISIRNIRGPMTLPCGTPLITGRGDDSVPFTITDYVRFERNSFIHDRSLPLIPKLKAFARTILWSTLSNALAKSRYMTSTLFPLKFTSHFIKVRPHGLLQRTHVKEGSSQGTS